MIEFRRGRDVEFVQFGVKKSARRPERIAPMPPDVTNILRGGTLGVRDTVIGELERVYGVVAVTEGLDRYERFLSGADRPRIGNSGAYLRTIIANKAREEAPAGQGTEQEKTAHVVVEGNAAPVTYPSRREVEDAERHRRFTLLRDQFAKLDPEKQLEWVRGVRDEADANSAPSPGVMKRLARGEWQSPLVQVMVIQHYARSELGDDWATLPMPEFENLMAVDAGNERDVI